MKVMTSTAFLALSFAVAAASSRAYAGFEIVHESPKRPSTPLEIVTEAQENSKLRHEVVQLASQLERLQGQLAKSEQHGKLTREDLLQANARLEELERQLGTLTVSFAFGATAFRPDAAQAQHLLSAARAADRVRIWGFADNVGSLATNKRITDLRAQAAKLYLEQRGVAPWKISAHGRPGEYAYPNDTPEGRAANRRVEFEFENRK